MKQATYRGKEQIVVVDGVRVDPEPDQVTIEVAYTGICGTDLHVFHGDMESRVSAGRVLGHEMSGRIAAVGSAVTDIAVGAPVTVMPIKSCGTCAACLRGYSHVCQNLVFIGIDANGSMQQFWNVSSKIVIPLPPEIPLIEAALVEPTAVAIHDARRSGVAAGDKALVVGGGPVGTLIALVVRSLGAEVLLLETNLYRAKLAADLGLDVVNPIEIDLAARVETWTGGAGADVAFEVSGAPAGLASAIENLAVRGRLCMVAIHTTKPPIDMHRLFWRELTIIGARLYDRSDFEEAVRLVAAGVIPTRTLISAVYPLDEAAKAFDALRAGGEVMKVLVGAEVVEP